MASVSKTRGRLAMLVALLVVLIGGHSYLRVLPHTVLPSQHPGQQICQSSKACAPDTHLAGPQMVTTHQSVAATSLLVVVPQVVTLTARFVPAAPPLLPDAPIVPALAIRPPPAL